MIHNTIREIDTLLKLVCFRQLSCSWKWIQRVRGKNICFPLSKSIYWRSGFKSSRWWCIISFNYMNHMKSTDTWKGWEFMIFWRPSQRLQQRKRGQEGIDQDLHFLLLFAFTRKQLNSWYIIQNSLVYKFLSLAGSSAGDVLVFGLRLWYEKMEKGGVWEFWKFYIFFWSFSWPPSRAFYQANDEATSGCWRYNIVLGWISLPHFCPRLVGYRIQRTTTIQIREVRFKRNRVRLNKLKV